MPPPASLPLGTLKGPSALGRVPSCPAELLLQAEEGMAQELCPGLSSSCAQDDSPSTLPSSLVAAESLSTSARPAHGAVAFGPPPSTAAQEATIDGQPLLEYTERAPAAAAPVFIDRLTSRMRVFHQVLVAAVGALACLWPGTSWGGRCLPR